MITVTRSYRLPAAHILVQPSLSDEENRRIFGKCSNPGGHGHDYEVAVTVTGPVDERTGQIIVPELLDEIFEDTIRARYSHTMLNEHGAFREQIPTAENIARVWHDHLKEPVANRSTARLLALTVIETAKNHVVYEESFAEICHE